ncbi:class C sortase [uncultured Faecalibaculum sp.]|uniref:class C sortase n=1 Tax=uncultured Faecalibaculum sp. TaxID=1729681 RepID=UPI0025FFF5E6|nr:class C sortase [uncultured Faecalibaculum sp.]
MKKKKSKFRDWLPWLGLLTGLLIVAWYPATEAMDAWRRSQIGSQLETQVQEQDDSVIRQLLQQAHAYNDRLAGKEPEIPEEQILPYEDQLMVRKGDQAFGMIVIPKLGLNMPIYHGTSETVLMAGTGHLKGTSLPVGGEDTHASVSAHTGMQNMRGFDELDQMKSGDIFGIRILGMTYAYKVESVEVVLPDEMDALEIQEGKDMVTLITCTPYGINDHRLLVHGIRTEVPEGYFDAKADPVVVLKSPRIWPFVLGTAIVVLLVIVTVVRNRKKRRKGKKTAL